MLSKRIQLLSESLTMAITSKARELKAAGEDVIGFSAGEPDFSPPLAVIKAAKEAIDSGNSKYTSVAGVPKVLEAIALKLKRDHGLIYSPNQIITNVGAKQSLFNIFQVLLDEGDEVIIPAPYWVTYPEVVTYSGAEPVFIYTNEKSSYKITPEQLKSNITKKTKILLLNSPSNPTGAVYSRSELEALGEVLKGTDIIVVSDEMYEKLTYEREFCSTASVSQDMFERTIVVNGLSKCAAMTGWRFGYSACVLDEVNKAIVKLQGQSTSNITSIVQYAAIPALLGEADEDMARMKKAFFQRRDLAANLINSIDGLSTLIPDGAFYLFVNIEKVNPNSMQFCEDLLTAKGIATVPGVGFGLDGHFRMSFATDEASIKKGIRRIKEFVESCS